MTFELEGWTLIVVFITLLCAWSTPAFFPALQSCARTAVRAVHATRGSRFLVPGTVTHTLGRQQAIRFFKGFVRIVCKLLRKRVKWAAFGQLLQHRRFRSLLEGIDRNKGILRRTAAVESPCDYPVQPVPTRRRAGRIR